MNSGVPGSPRNGGPLFQAYQYVRSVPSASRLVIELSPFSLTRIFLFQPVVEIRAVIGGHRFAVLAVHLHIEPDIAGLLIDLDLDAAGAGGAGATDSSGKVTLSEQDG